MGRSVAALVLVGIVAAAALAVTERVITYKTPHLTFTLALSADVARSNSQLSLMVNVRPREGVHVYAPGSTYRAIAIALEPNPLLSVGKTIYPQSSMYFFKPLKESVPVYNEPFTLTVPVAIGAIPRGTSALRVSGVVTYQACDDRVCFLPETVPVAWTVAVR